MTPVEKLKEDLETIKTFSLRQKLRFIWEYYKTPIIAILAVIGIAFSLISTSLGQKNYALSGAMLNADPRDETAAPALAERFLSELALDPEKFQVSINAGLTYVPNDKTQVESNYTTMELLIAQMSGRFLDFLIGNEKTMTALAYSEFFVDLSTVLPAEQLEKHAQRILYMDLAVLEAFKKAVENEDYEAKIDIPDPTMPEKMEKPIPILLIVDECEDVKALYSHTTEKVVFGVAVNYPQKENLLRFLDFLFS